MTTKSLQDKASESGRLTYIDVLETIAIFCIAMCHQVETMGVSTAATVILQFITAFSVPIFLMANGTLLMNRSLNIKKHYRKTALLFLSVTAWKLLYFLFFFAMNKFPVSDLHGSELLGYFLGGNLENPYIPAEHFWYIYVMVGIYLIFPFIHTLYHSEHKKAYYVILAISFALFIVIEDFTATAASLPEGTWMSKIPLSVLEGAIGPFSLRTGVHIVYFMVGPVLHELFYGKETKARTRIVLGVLAVVGFGVLLLERMIGGFPMNGVWVRLTADYRRVGLVLMCTSTYALFAGISKYGPKLTKICTAISIRTMGIYAIHNAVAVLLSIINSRYLGMSNIGFHLLKTLLVFGISLGAAEVLSFIPGVRKVLNLTWRGKK